MEIRELTDDDRVAAWQLGVEAFGGPPPGTPPPEPSTSTAGRHVWGAFDEGRLAAKVVGLDFGSWFGGAPVPTCGVAGVAVGAEHRGRGLLRPLFEHLLRGAAARGDVVSTLFPTANGIYRSFGYELISSFDTVEIPTAQLGGVPPTSTSTRRATVTDVPAIRGVYDTWAAAQNGPLTRRDPRFDRPDEQLLADVTAVTLAVAAGGEVTGYLVWQRGDRYDRSATIRVEDLVAVDPDAHRALWAMLGTFASVTGTVRLTTSGDDAARHVLRTAAWDVVERHPYMLRVLDLPGAVAALAATLPLALATVELTVAGDTLGLIDGGYRLTVGDGPASCARADVGGHGPRFTAPGIALAYAGAQSCANLRMLGTSADRPPTTPRLTPCSAGVSCTSATTSDHS